MLLWKKYSLVPTLLFSLIKEKSNLGTRLEEALINCLHNDAICTFHHSTVINSSDVLKNNMAYTSSIHLDQTKRITGLLSEIAIKPYTSTCPHLDCISVRDGIDQRIKVECWQIRVFSLDVDY